MAGFADSLMIYCHKQGEKGIPEIVPRTGCVINPLQLYRWLEYSL